MANVYNRTYRYAPGGSAVQKGDVETRISSSSLVYYDGDTEHPMMNILSVKMSTYIRKWKSGSSTRTWYAGIVLSDGNTVSGQATASGVSISAPKSVSVGLNLGGGYTQENIVELTSALSDTDTCTCFGEYPLYATFTYESEEYKPEITEFTAERCDAQGVPDREGTHAKITYAYDVIPATEDVSASLTITNGTTTYTLYGTKAQVDANRGQTAVYIYPDEVLTGYDYRFTIKLDYDRESASDKVTLRRVSAPLSFNNYSVGIGQEAAGSAGDERLDVNWSANFHAGVYGVTNVHPNVVEDTGGWWIEDGVRLKIKRAVYVVNVTTTGTFNTGIHLPPFSAILRLGGTIFQQGRYWNQMGWNVGGEDFNVAVADGQLQVIADKVGTAFVEVVFVDAGDNTFALPREEDEEETNA